MYYGANRMLIDQQMNRYIGLEGDALIELLEELMQRTDTTVDFQQPVAILSFSYYSDVSGYYGDYRLYFNPTSTQLTDYWGE